MGLFGVIVNMFVSVFVWLLAFAPALLYVLDNSGLTGIEYSLVKAMVVMAPIAIMLIHVGFFMYTVSKPVPEDEKDFYLDTSDIAVEPKRLTVRDAKKILKIRFAKGEISSEEYTERMSRL